MTGLPERPRRPLPGGGGRAGTAAKVSWGRVSGQKGSVQLGVSAGSSPCTSPQPPTCRPPVHPHSSARLRAAGTRAPCPGAQCTEVCTTWSLKPLEHTVVQLHTQRTTHVTPADTHTHTMIHTRGLTQCGEREARRTDVNRSSPAPSSAPSLDRTAPRCPLGHLPGSLLSPGALRASLRRPLRPAALGLSVYSAFPAGRKILEGRDRAHVPRVFSPAIGVWRAVRG